MSQHEHCTWEAFINKQRARISAPILIRHAWTGCKAIEIHPNEGDFLQMICPT